MITDLDQTNPLGIGANQQRVSTEIIIEIKQLNTGRMALHAFIESVWCSHWEMILSSKMEEEICKSSSLISITLKLKKTTCIISVKVFSKSRMYV